MNVITEWFQRHLADRQVVVLTLMLVGVFLALALFGEMMAPAIAAVVIAFLLDGMAEVLRKRGVSNLVASVATFLTFLLVSFVAIVGILPPIVSQFGQFFGQLPNMITKLQDSLVVLQQEYPNIISQTQLNSLFDQVGNEMIHLGQSVVKSSVGGIGNLITWAVYLILVPVMVFFFIKDRAIILKWLANLMPKDHGLVQQVWHEVLERAGDYARGKVYEILIVGFVSYGAYSIIDLQFAAFLALLTGLSVIIPYIGAASVTIPVAIVAMAQWGIGPDMAMAVIVYLVLQAFDGNLLAPLLFSEVVKLHPNAIILSILFFGGIWGLWGVFFAIPLATLADAVMRAWISRRPLEEMPDKADH